MKNLTNSRELYLSVEKEPGLFSRMEMYDGYVSSGFYGKFERYRQYDMNKIFAKPAKLSYDLKKKEFTLKYKDKVFKTNRISHLRGEDNFFFKDNETNQYFMINRDAKMIGPFKDILLAETLTNIEYNPDPRGIDYVTKENYFLVLTHDNKILNVSKDLVISDTGNEYVSETALKNKDGKYALNNAGKADSEFIFDDPDLQAINLYGGISLVPKGDTLSIVCEKKKIAELKDFDVSSKKFERRQDGNFLLSDSKKSYLINEKTGNILFESDKPYNKEFHHDDALVLNYDGKAVYLKVKGETVEKNELPYEILTCRNDVLLARNSEGKCGVIDKNNKILEPFEYDDLTKVSHYENKSEVFIPVYKNGKMGAYNTISKHLDLPPQYNEVILTDRHDVDQRVVSYDKGESNHPTYEEGDLFRFFFRGEDGKLGVVNSKNHIVIDPVLEETHSYSSGFYKEPFSSFHEMGTGSKGDYKRVYINLASPYLFPQTPQSVTSYDKKKVRKAYSHNTYSDGDIAASTVLGGALFGVVGAAIAYGYTSSQRSTSYKTETVTTERRDDVMHSVPDAVKAKIHMDYKDIPVDICPKEILEEMALVEIFANSGKEDKQEVEEEHE